MQMTCNCMSAALGSQRHTKGKAAAMHLDVNDLIDLGLVMVAQDTGLVEAQVMARVSGLTAAHAAITPDRVRARIDELVTAGYLERLTGADGPCLRTSETGRAHGVALLARWGTRTCALVPVTAGLRMALAAA